MNLVQIKQLKKYKIIFEILVSTIQKKNDVLGMNLFFHDRQKSI